MVDVPSPLSMDSMTERPELKERDLLSRLELYAGHDSDDGVDCSLKLGFSDIHGKQAQVNVTPSLNQWNGGCTFMSLKLGRGDWLKKVEAWERYEKWELPIWTHYINYYVMKALCPWWWIFQNGNYYMPLKMLQNNGVMNGAYGYYYHNRYGAQMNLAGWRDGFVHQGSPSSFIDRAVSTCALNNSYARYQSMAMRNNAPVLNFHGYARQCDVCGTTSTPLWRNGPRGPKTLCNACGIRFRKEEKRANGNP